MNDGDSYDRLMEKIADSQDARLAKLEDRMLKMELWRNTTLTIFVTLVFLAGIAARDLVAFAKHLVG